MSSGGAVTVVIPTHNRRNYLLEAISSALRSDSTTSVIVVDDGSSDGSFEAASALTDPRVVVRRISTPGGGSAARNIGLEECQTEMVMFLDDDDLLVPGALDRLRTALYRHPSAAGVAGRYVRFGDVPDHHRPLHPRLVVERPVWRELLFGWNMPPASLLWRTEVVRAIGGWREDYRSSEDRDINLRAYPRPFVLIPTKVVHYRVHGAQVTASDRWALHQERLRVFADSLPEPDRATGLAIVEIATRMRQAVAAYLDADFRSARPVFEAARSPELGLSRSPIVGPWLAAMTTKSFIFEHLPPNWVEMMRVARRLARGGKTLASGEPDRR